jgi:hypothetical protein
LTNDAELDRWLALYRDCCAQSGIEPLDDEARELARKFHDLLAPALEREFRLH